MPWKEHLGYGYFRLAQTLPPVGEIRVGIVQPNVTHERKWAKSFVPAQFEDLREDSLALESDGVELLVWPESALPVKIPENTESLPSEIKLERAGLLFGAVAIADDGNGVPAEKKYFNSAWLSDESGAILGKYRKQHLVPVGEYIPWKRIFTSAKSLTSPMGEVLPGGQGEPLQFHGKALGILICYEDIFPEIARRTVGLGAEILVELTNDAWYGWSGASRQHLAISQLRSIETRREGLRAANSGISALIDRKGRVLWQSVLFQRQAFASGLRLYRDLSFYARFGDVFAYFSLAFTGLMMVIAWSRK
ncbi:MAG: apolipoprotein N-acyltransferase [Deltaproteobacteria bacterium]|nr:apolipoprotein N-acyltransferase [Deltaproteobacteria bacterium]